MHAAGAAVIDVGGESTRPRAEKLWEGDEIARVIPVIERLVAAGVPVSIDTRKAAVMRAALAAGAVMVNDISALSHDPESLGVVAGSTAAVVLMHSPSSGDDPHANPHGYGDVVANVFDHLESRIATCVAAGIDRSRILVDPGLGFGKSLADNLALTNALAAFQALGQPVLYAASRKTMIGALSNEAPVSARLGGSVALAYQAAASGVQMVRVHDVPETLQAIHVWRGLRDAALTAP
jgi:dihydropteroate synthase